MNSLFLILVAAPLAVYLVIILFFSGDLDESESRAEPAVTPAEHALASTLDSEMERTDTPEPLPASQIVLALPSESSAMEESGLAPVAEPIEAQAEAVPVAGQSVASLPVVQESASLSVETVPSVDVSLESVPLTSAEGASLARLAPASTIQVKDQAEQPVEKQTPTPSAPALDARSLDGEEAEPILPEGPLRLPDKGSPKYAFDYRGRLWVEKKRKGFFRQLRRPQLPPEEPPTTSER